jgi:hypothetical protein
MTKTSYFFPLLLGLLFTANASAQKRNSALQIGGQYGPTPYETLDAFGVNAGYEWDFHRMFSAVAVAGFVRGGDQVEGRSSGQDAGGSWDNSYAYSIEEQFNYLDLTGLINFTPNSKRNRFEIGLGTGLTYTVLKYPKDLYIERGIINNLNYTRHKEMVAMAHITFANRLLITDRLEVFARLTGRQAFKEGPILTREVRFDGGALSSSSNNIRNNFTITLGVGYRL